MNPKNQIKIFIVEDNQLFSMTLKTYIETSFCAPCSANYVNRNIKIFLFETGETCMEKFKVEKPQVVILDYHLNNRYPDAADGLKVLDWIKKENNKTNVIMLTNNDNIDIAIQSFKHGASDYVVKTETQFEKINYSLHNLFNIVDAKNDVRRYRCFFGLFLFLFALLAGAVVLIQLFFFKSIIK